MEEEVSGKFLKKNIAIIPARGGSTGIINKNIKSFNGKPLIQYSIESALNCSEISNVIVSTDSEQIRDLSLSLGAEVPFLRPVSISKAETPIEPVLIHALEYLLNTYDLELINSLILLFPTNPLRKIEHIRGCLDIYDLHKADSAFTVNESPAHYTPYWTLINNKDNIVTYFNKNRLTDGYSRRQDFPEKCFAKNDLVFVISPRNLFKAKPSIFGENNRVLVVDKFFDGDINDESDWKINEIKYNFINMY
jgi:CMP-N,N'-diacetyllegionaminic acid synthase